MEHIIKTDRLFLQPLGESDMSFMQALAARPESYRYDSDKAQTSDKIAKRCHCQMKALSIGS